jgi:ABC-type multidrug transport system fused ATPase/permease subunit
VLLLDEATAQVDGLTEAGVRECIRRLVETVRIAPDRPVTAGFRGS